ncbi:MAG: zinc-ribbon domain containing protein [Dehalococcoidia bacterium]
MLDTSDIKLVCRECGKGFLFTEGEQEFYKNKGLTTPSRCPDCRVTKRAQTQSMIHNHSLVCSHCRTELEKDESVFCTACLASTQLESELKVKECQSIVEKAKAELSTLESQKIEIEDSLLKTSELLQQKEHHTEELEHRLSTLKQELEKAKQFQTTLEWLKPSLSKLEERLDALEEGQNKANQRMLQIVQKMHEINENTGIWERIRRNLFGYQRQSI